MWYSNAMWRMLCATSIVVSIWLTAACGGGRTLTPEQQATATAQSALATFAALPPEIKAGTQTAVMATIEKGLNP